MRFILLDLLKTVKMPRDEEVIKTIRPNQFDKIKLTIKRITITINVREW